MISTLVGAISGVPQRDKTCVVERCSAGEWNYEVGKVFSFQYEVEATTAINGASDQRSTFSFNAIADIGAVSPCNFVLKLRGVRGGKAGSTEAEDFSRLLERYTTNFAMESGLVTQVCSTSSDPVWVVNLKKGILSTFQQNIEPSMGNGNITETSVVGRYNRRKASISRQKQNKCSTKKQREVAANLHEIYLTSDAN